MEKNNSLKYVAVSLLLGCLIQPIQAKEAEDKWTAFVDVEGKMGSKRHLGEMDFFIPLMQNSDSLFYTDIRYRADNSSSREGNFGLGIRHILPSDWIIGGYGYFDRRRSSYDNMFSQVTLGLEALSTDWDFRANVYIPTGKDVYTVESHNTAEVSDASIIFKGGEEHSMNGYDAEIGWRVPFFDKEEEHQVRLYAGGYRFYKDGLDGIEGPRGRVELSFDEVPFLWKGSRFTLGAETQRDDVRGRQSFASFRLRIPFSTSKLDKVSSLSAIEKRMTTPIVRDVDIVSQAGAFGKPEVVTQLADGTDFTFISESSATTAAEFNDVLLKAGEDSTVIASGSYLFSNTITVQRGQTLMGGSSIEVRSPSGRTARFTPPGLTITSSPSLAGDLIKLSMSSTLKNTVVNHTRTSGSTSSAVSARLVDHVVIENNIITSRGGTFGAMGINVQYAAQGKIVGNTIIVDAEGGAAAYGLLAEDSTLITVADNDFRVLTPGANRHVIYVGGNTIFEEGSNNNTAVNGQCFFHPSYFPRSTVNFTNITCRP